MVFQFVSGQNRGSVPLPPLRALLLDDDAFDRTRIRRFAEKARMPVVIDEVPSISDMSKALRRDAYDLFLLDYHLPEGDGLKAIDLIQDNETNKDAAVIIITGRDREHVAASAFQRGCHDLLTKSELSPSLLWDRMGQALDRARHLIHQDLFEQERRRHQLQEAQRRLNEADAAELASTRDLSRALIGRDGREKATIQHDIEVFLDDVLGAGRPRRKH